MRREDLVEPVRCLKGIVELRVGHRAGLKPAVEDLRRAAIGLAVPGDHELVDHVLVEVFDLLSRELFELGLGPDADHVCRVHLIDPERDARPPEAVPGHVPVHRVSQPVPEARLSDGAGDPVHLCVVRDEVIPDVLDLHVPSVDRAVDERGVRPLAEGIAVGQGRVREELPGVLQAADDGLVGLLAVRPCEVWGLLGEARLCVERVDELEPLAGADSVVILAVSGRHVDDPCALRGGDEVIPKDLERTLRVLEEGEQRLIAPADERCSLQGLMDLRAFAEHSLYPRRGDEEEPLSILCAADAVVELWTDADAEVRWQRPRCGRPCQHRHVPVHVEPRSLREPHGDCDRRVLDVLVVAVGFEVGERGRQLPAVGHDPMRAVDPVLVPQLLKDPPDRLHELEVHGLVVIIKVDPAPHPVDDLAPVRDVGLHHRATLLVELCDPVVGDLPCA